jgi:tetratricopeptide (TPR) repeat protein
MVLAPGLAEPHAALGLGYEQRRRFVESRAEFERALALEPDDLTANFWFGTALTMQGYLGRANARLDHVLALDPAHPNANYWRGANALGAGDVALAERLVGRAQELGLVHAGFAASTLAAARGRREEAAAVLATAFAPQMPEFPPGTAEVLSRGVFGDAAARARALEVIDRYLATRPHPLNGSVPYLLLRLGLPERGMELEQHGTTTNEATFFHYLWQASGKDARRSPMFPAFARDVGLADVWERFGPPDACTRKAPREYVCR